VADNCFEAGCAPGERCVDFICEADPCDGLFCNDGEFCRDGRCVRSCATVSCPAGEACQDGQCIADACAGLSCPDGQRCLDGACAADPCSGVTCEPGLACADGVCAGDPCHNVACPPNERCEVQSGVAQCVAAWGPETPTTDPDAGPPVPTDAGPPVLGDGGPGLGGADSAITDSPETGPPSGNDGISKGDAAEAAGCACRTGTNTPAPAWLGLLGLAAWPAARRRRRR
jgi:MYXO-CTERM domain-containing protein